MINNRELKEQVDQLTKQNKQLTEQLQELKNMLQNEKAAQSASSSSAGNEKQSGQSQRQGQGQAQSQGQGQSQGQSQKQQSAGGTQQIGQIAGELLQLKGMADKLENKMRSYTSGKTSGSAITEEDLIGLIITMMNGMIDWTVDYVSKKQSGGQQ